MTAPVVHLGDIVKRPGVFTIWERRRNTPQVHWFMECFAEAFGVFLYVYFGVGSQIGWIFGNIIKQEGFSSVLQIGLAYAFGIVFAITICAPTSGGHFNPCVTIAMVIFKGFPKAKALRYIVSQIFGSFIASLVVYSQWKVMIDLSETAISAAGPGALQSVLFTPNGPAGAFGNYLLPGQTMPRVFMNEFVNCTVLAILIWACLDPSNIVIPPSVGTFVIAFGYAAAIWGFAVPGVSLNASRDVGARLAAMAIWGTAAAGDSYSAITALVNIPATLFGALIYETFLHDSDRVVSTASLEFIRAHTHNRRFHQATEGHEAPGHQTLVQTNSHEKPSITTFENAPNRV
ncbi:hypothetical protein D9619_004228 [Psilocybe cf. subviscida]|uniref:Aquaporin-like protein n=1 Tax=Psilocybe cf. subviscida TaxID=2480587 RepID=A0A8H5F8U0_9AGAR|nr:hypothetical protein D9619_004228 [Psilocybe cf. subviscida]